MEKFLDVLSRLCIRHLKGSPRIDQKLNLYGFLFDDYDTNLDLWGVEDENIIYENMKT